MPTISIDIHEGRGRRTVTVDAAVVRIGRDPDCEIHLPGDTTVSRVHATLRECDGAWWVADNDSRNGTVVNGARLSAPRQLTPSDRIWIGGFVLVPHAGADRFVETATADAAAGTRARAESGLSARELDVLRLVVTGHTDKQVAAALVLSLSTVQTHLDRIRDKTGVRRRPELVRWAIERGIA